MFNKQSYIAVISLLCLSLNIFITSAKPNKIIGLMAVRNESQMVEQALKALACYTDGIIVLDDASDDNTVEVLKRVATECNIVKIIEKPEWHRDEPGDKNKLLNAGRKAGGTHFIVIDADEVFTSNCLDDDYLRKQILTLKPGETMLCTWIQLWRSPYKFRCDDSVWSKLKGDFIFCDTGKCSYSSNFIHTSRSPNIGLKGKTHTLKAKREQRLPNCKKDFTMGLMHFQFVNWKNLLIKQAWYRCLEKIRNPKVDIEHINKIYGRSKDETNIGLVDSPKEWFIGYNSFDADLYTSVESWQKKQILQWFEQYGQNYFKQLDIWDINWN